ncbi:MAG: hypothetical protein M3Q95_03165 [Bacteroidota bacterium]|nr:hypothetical protein [Bacteroidota bacterium]
MEGYIPVKNSNYQTEYRYGVSDPLVVIDDSIAYKNKFSFHVDSMPFGFIDFNKYSLICGSIKTDQGNGLNHQGGLCYHPGTNKWMMTVEYTLTGQCKGSGLNSQNFVAAIICPKLPVGAVVELNVTNINPL